MQTFNKFLAIALLALATLSSQATAARLALRPLTSLELRRALLESQAAAAGNGRSVSSALAGLKGFALGITKGVGGALLFDVITSNETAAYISNMLENSNGGNTNAGTTQEVCFASRSVDGDSPRQGRQHNAVEDEDEDELGLYEDDEDESEAEGRDDGSDMPTTSGTLSPPTATTTHTGTGTARQLDYSDTPSVTTPDEDLGVDTDAGGGTGAITCIVVNRGGRAFVRHRRSWPVSV